MALTRTGTPQAPARPGRARSTGFESPQRAGQLEAQRAGRASRGRSATASFISSTSAQTRSHSAWNAAAVGGHRAVAHAVAAVPVDALVVELLALGGVRRWSSKRSTTCSAMNWNVAWAHQYVSGSRAW